MNTDKGEARGNRRDAEDTEEKAKRDPSAGLRQRRRPQDDDARPIVRGAECAGRGLAGWAAWLTSWQAGAQPFDPALRDLRMNRAAARFTSSAPTPNRRMRGRVCGRRARHAVPLRLS